MSNSVRPHRRQPTRLPRPWDSSGKNTGVGFHFLLQCMKVKSESEVAQSRPTLSDPMDCSLPGSSTHGIFQARVLEWGAIAFSDGMYEIYININVNKTLYEMHFMLCCFMITSSCLFLICWSYTALLFFGFPILHFFQYFLSRSLRNFILFLSFDHLSISLQFLFWVLEVLRYHEKTTSMTVNTQSKWMAFLICKCLKMYNIIHTL